MSETFRRSLRAHILNAAPPENTITPITRSRWPTTKNILVFIALLAMMTVLSWILYHG